MSASSPLGVANGPEKGWTKKTAEKKKKKNIPDVDLPVGRRDHLHLCHFSVDDLGRDVELVDHAQRDGPSAGLKRGAAGVSRWEEKGKG